jgi:hypothetical protein
MTSSVTVVVRFGDGSPVPRIDVLDDDAPPALVAAILAQAAEVARGAVLSAAAAPKPAEASGEKH